MFFSFCFFCFPRHLTTTFYCQSAIMYWKNCAIQFKQSLFFATFRTSLHWGRSMALQISWLLMSVKTLISVIATKKDVWELQQHSADLTSHTGGGCWHIILVTHFSTSRGNYGKWHGRPIENSALSWKLTHAHQKMEKQDRGECSSPVRIIAWQRIFLGKKQLWQNEKLSFFLTKKTSCHGTITPGVERLSCVHWEMKVTGLSVITKSH